MGERGTRSHPDREIIENWCLLREEESLFTRNVAHGRLNTFQGIAPHQ